MTNKINMTACINGVWYDLVKQRGSNLTSRTITIINRGGRIILKRKEENSNYKPTYLGAWSNIAAGPDSADWTYQKKSALEFFNLEWAYAIAPLYNCKVIVLHKKKKL